MSGTVSWFITFGFGQAHSGQYTEIKVPACYSTAHQNVYARQMAFERYGKAWAFDYPPEAFEDSIASYGMTLREVIEA